MQSFDAIAPVMIRQFQYAHFTQKLLTLHPKAAKNLFSSLVI